MPDKRIRVCLIFLLLFAINDLFGESDKNRIEKQYNILFFSTYGKDIPAQKAIEKGLNKAFESDKGKYAVYYEFMDSSNTKTIDNSFYVDYLNKKYQNIHFDFVMTWSDDALYVFCKNRDLFPDSQRILFDIEEEEKFRNSGYYSDDDIILLLNFNYQLTLNEMFRIADPEKIVVIATTYDSAGLLRLGRFQKDIIGFEDRVEVDYLINRNIDEIVAKLDEYDSRTTIVFYLLMFSDGKGNKLTPYQIINIISDKTDLPVFSYWDSLMGSGIVGGNLISMEAIGIELGHIILQSETVNEKHFTITPMEIIYDYKAVKKHNIDLNDIPAGSVLINEPLNVLKLYKWPIFIISLAVVFIVILLFFLYRQNVIKKSNAKLVETKDELRRINEELKELSITDPLTGLYNRNITKKIITDEINRSNRFGHSVSLMILDLDHFKKVNDTYGHSAGDQVLQRVSRILKDSVRVTDRIARWGGEEFLILAISTSIKKACIMAEKIRKMIEDSNNNEEISITISIGVAEYNSSEDFQDWFDRADKALYKAKENGRNRVESITVKGSNDKDSDLVKIVWDDNYLCGNDHINKQHKELFNSANDLTSAYITEKDKTEIELLLDNLLAKIRQHFFDEEQILAELKFKGLKKHAEKHRVLISQASALESKYKEDDLDGILLLKFIVKDVINNHILLDDTIFFPALSKSL